MQNIFITGISSGIGLGLAKYYSKNNVNVYGVSRRVPGFTHNNLKHTSVDLCEYTHLKDNLDKLFKGVKSLDLVVLNAGILGTISPMKKVSLATMKEVMEVNMWSQKVLIDYLLERFPKVKTIIAISSGASTSGALGWNGYSLSKAAINMLILLYANEVPDTKFYAFAPGLVDTAMQDYICGEVPQEEYPTVARIKGARGTDDMPTPDSFAPKFDGSLGKLFTYPSGSFVDIRKMS